MTRDGEAEHRSTGLALEVDLKSDVQRSDFVENYLLPRRPLVLREAIVDWKALSSWDLDFFRRRFGARKVDIDGTLYGMAQLMDLVERSTPERPAPYLRAKKIRELFPELLEDVLLPFRLSTPNWPDSRILPRKVRRLVSPELLIGGRGCRFPMLHFDTRYLHAFVAQIMGCKEFVLFPPSQTPFLYAKPEKPNQSAIDDVFEPDYERFPLFANARPASVTIGPGETLFVPAGWWHTTRLPETSISVTWNCANSSNWSEFVRDIADSPRRPALARAFGMYAGVFGWFRRGL